jgi:hypothetical protein
VLDKGFCVDQPRLDFPEAVVAKIAQALDRAAVHEAALVFRLVLVRRGHRDSQLNGCGNPSHRRRQSQRPQAGHRHLFHGPKPNYTEMEVAAGGGLSI